jgi:uncharacterized protein YbjT (DUF2867 family)
MTGVLVTGCTGGPGSEVVPRLVQAGYTVRVMSRHDRRGASGRKQNGHRPILQMQQV